MIIVHAHMIDACSVKSVVKHIVQVTIVGSLIHGFNYEKNLFIDLKSPSLAFKINKNEINPKLSFHANILNVK